MDTGNHPVRLDVGPGPLETSPTPTLSFSVIVTVPAETGVDLRRSGDARDLVQTPGDHTVFKVWPGLRTPFSFLGVRTKNTVDQNW